MKTEGIYAFILSSIIIMSLASSVYGPVPEEYNSTPQNGLDPALTPPEDSYPPEPLVNQEPIMVPPDNREATTPETDITMSNSDTESVQKSISSYVTIESRDPLETESHTFLQTTIPDPQRYGSGYVTIYSLINQNVSQSSPLVSFSLLNPPLVIDYTVEPLKISEIKYVEYKELASMHEESHVITRPYEDAWFKIIVTNKDNGQIVAEDGFGRVYSLQSPKQLVLRETGNYTFEFTGIHATLDLTMKVKEEGNFP